jgi:hypothetical protein
MPLALQEGIETVGLKVTVMLYFSRIRHNGSETPNANKKNPKRLSENELGNVSRQKLQLNSGGLTICDP